MASRVGIIQRFRVQVKVCTPFQAACSLEDGQEQLRSVVAQHVASSVEVMCLQGNVEVCSQAPAEDSQVRAARPQGRLGAAGGGEPQRRLFKQHSHAVRYGLY